MVVTITVCSSCPGARNVYGSLVDQFSGSEGIGVTICYSQTCIRGCGMGSRVDLTRDGAVVRYAANSPSATSPIRSLSSLVEDARQK